MGARRFAEGADPRAGSGVSCALTGQGWAGNSVENVEKPTLLAHPDSFRFRRLPAVACRLGLVGAEAGAWRSLVALGCLEAVARAGTGAGVDARIGARSVARSRR